MSQMPTTPVPATARISSITQTTRSVAHSLRRIVSSRGGQRWSIELEWAPMTRADFAPLWAFIVAQRGSAQSFDITLPQHAAQGSMAGTPLVDGADQSGNALATKGWTASATGVLKAGDFIRIAGSYKTHMITADVDADASGDASLSIEPSLQNDIADEAALSANGLFRCALTSDDQAVNLSNALHYGFSVAMIEVLD